MNSQTLLEDGPAEKVAPMTEADTTSQNQKLDVEWTESESFRIWFRLARGRKTETTIK